MRDSGPILLPLDGSDLSGGAIPYAEALARAINAKVLLLTVWEGIENELGATFPSMALDVQEKAQAHFEEYLAGAQANITGVEVETLVRSGRPADEILNVARDADARLIVLATHGRSGLSRWAYGSTAGVAPGTLAQDAYIAAVFTTLGWGLLNLLPILPLDGGQVLQELLPGTPAVRMRRAAAVSVVAGIAVAMVAWKYGHPFAAVLAAFFVVSNVLTLRQDNLPKRRRGSLRLSVPSGRANPLRPGRSSIPRMTEK